MLLLSRIIFILLLAFASVVAIPQQKSNTLSIDTEFSSNQFTIDKVDKSLSGDKLVYGSAVQMRKQVGIDNVKIVTRRSAYNCARKEFVIKEATVQDRAGLPITQTSIKTDTIIVPELDVNKKEVAFMCGEAAPLKEETIKTVEVPQPVVTIEKKAK